MNYVQLKVPQESVGMQIGNLDDNDDFHDEDDEQIYFASTPKGKGK